jgi:predicted CoA-binding protein
METAQNLHNMSMRETIDRFLRDKKLAIAGVSHNPKKFGYILYKTAREKGYSVIPINPKGGKIDDVTCIQSAAMLDSDIHQLLIATHKRDSVKVMEEAIAKGIRNIWIQNGCESDEAINIAKENNVNLVYKECFLMYAWPKGIHKFHQVISNWIGKYKKEITITKVF